MRLLGRLLLGAFALVLAIPCGVLVLTAGALIDPVSRDLVGHLGIVAAITALVDLASGVAPDIALLALLAFTKALATLLVLPPTLGAVIGEMLHLRAPAWYAGASGLLTASLPWLVRRGTGPSSRQDALAAEGRVMAVLFLAGAASGLVYWLVAGRSAAPLAEAGD